jgi:hypothetical protein
MANTDLPVHWRFVNQCSQARQFTRVPTHFDVAILQDSQTSRIVAAVL